MAQQVIKLGTAPQGKDGDTSRTAFDKTNQNFTELYARRSVGMDRVRDFVAGANSGGTTIDMRCESAVFRDAEGRVNYRTVGVTYTCNVAAAGPAVNGRDRAVAFTSGWIHFYFICNPATGAKGSIGSPNDKTVGPVLPDGFTEWVYACTCWVEANGTLRGVDFCGSRAQYKSGLNLATVSNGTLTNANLVAHVPFRKATLRTRISLFSTNASGYRFLCRKGGTTNPLEIVADAFVPVNGMWCTTANTFDFDIGPNNSLDYQLQADSMTVTAGGATVTVMGYIVNNGDN